MSTNSTRSVTLLAGMIWALVAGAPAVADDTELFVYDSSVLAVNPNVLFIFDTSGSMDTYVESQENYDPAKPYAGTCVDGRLYWRSATWFDGDPPTCDTDRWFEKSAFQCKAGLDAFATNAGRLTDQFAQYNSNRERWENLQQSRKNLVVECNDDGGKHGDGSDPDETWPRNSDGAALWGTTKKVALSGFTTQTVYDANYLNWYYGPTGPSTRSQVMKDVATSLIGSINGVNIGLMRFNDNQGGRLVHPVNDIAANRDALVTAINGLPASGFTPLSETFYEAARYFLGYEPYYGNSTVGVGADGAYQTPVEFGCQKNYVVYLTDGEPTEDTDATSRIPNLPDFAAAVGASSCDGSGSGACLDDLAHYLYAADLDPVLPGKQNVVTYTIGFTVDLPLLDETAQLGGGRYYTADDTASLSQALTNIVTSILQTQTTFTSPTVSVNSFNRTRHLNDLFITLFQPSSNMHWPGNLKKYRLRASDTTIVDANNQPAVDPSTGFFFEGAQSWWSTSVDGRKVAVGGAANNLPPPASRNVYTYVGGALSAVDATNSSITDAILGIGNTGDPSRADVISFIRGQDVADSNQNNSKTDARNEIGDPLHSQPVSIIYGGTLADPDIDDALVFFATNDGYLHAVDPSTGVESWSFLAPEFLADQAGLLLNPTATGKHYGIDGSLRLQVYANNDGVIDASNEKVYLYFGMRRGGTVYYGLDVTDPDSPEVMWRLDQNDLPGVGQTWSSPTPTRVSVDGTAKMAIIFGGGYDTTQDNYTATTDDSGNAIYMVDSATGDLLWHGGQSGATKDFAKMQYSIPADVRVIDLDSDGLADRMYAADMGGQVWRFDIFNGKAASQLVNGGVIAQLGSAGVTDPTAADTRRFYYAPDVALVSNDEMSFLHVGIGSGYRAHPNASDNHDRFYALRDYNPFEQLAQADFDGKVPVTDGDLLDITDDVDAVVPAGSPGWRLFLGTGEKVLAEARTFNNQVFFTTFTPGAPPNANNCEPRLGTNRLYVLNLFNGGPATNLDGSVGGELTASDRSQEFNGSIASEVVFMFPSPDDENCVGEECIPPPVACVDLFCFPTNFANAPVRTFWNQESLDR